MKPFNRTRRRARIHGQRRSIDVGLERCEDRFLLTTFLVSNNSNLVATTHSLPWAIGQVNQDTGNPGVDTITFGLPSNELEIDLASTLTVTHPVLIDGTIQTNYAFGTTMVQVNGSTNSVGGDGLILGANSNGSTIQGLDIVGFASGAAIHVESSGDTVASNELGVTTTGTHGANQYGVLVDDVGPTTIGGAAATANVIGFNTSAGVSISGASGSGNVVAANFIGTDAAGANLGNAVGVAISASSNTIGGTVSGAGNTIAFNTGDGVDVISGNGNAIRQDLIYGNTGTGIVLTGTANNGQQPPSGLAYTSVANLTTIDYTVNGTSGQTYAIDFFASSGANRPAAVYLGSTSVTLTASSQSFTATLNLPTALVNGQTVTATATDPNGNSSAFAASASFTNPFQVSTGSDSGVGSLRQAILDADAAGGNPTITFTLPSPFQITPISPLPAITQSVVMNGFVSGTTMAQVIGSTNHVGGDGLVLAAGSDGSTIEGLDIIGFATGAGIHVVSAGDTIESNDLGVTTTGTNGANQVGVLVDNAGSTTIGGTTTGAANAIGFNATAGVQIIGTTTTDDTKALVEGNFIGTDSLGTHNWGNGSAVQVFNASDNTIGGTATGATSAAANIIGFNKNTGIAILTGTGNTILSNTYIGTNGLLQTPSVAASDIGVSVNANDNLQPPQILSASLTNGTLSIALAVAPSVNTSLDVYLLGSNQRTFLGDASVAANATFTTLSVSGLANGDQIVATQTNSADGTSAFSAPLQVEPATTVTNVNDAGAGSLRAAIAAAESGGSTDITFQIPGTGPFTIALNSPLLINGSLTIDGTSELTSQKTPAVVLSPSVGGATSGMELTTGTGSTIEGLQFSGFSGPAIIVGSGSNTIGGTTAGAGNVLGTSGSAGVSITGASNVLEGNFIGTDAAADNLGNAQGVIIDNSGSNTIGGTTAGSGNTIAFSSTAGVSISGSSATHNVLEGNFIGTNATGAKLGNNLGVIIDGASNNTVGGTVTNAGNTIAFNGSQTNAGALIVHIGTGNTILDNLFYGNGNTGSTIATSGINLTGGGNDSPNLPAPSLTGVTSSGSGSTVVTLNVSGMTPGQYVLDVFSSAPGDSPTANQVDAHVQLVTTTETISAGETTLPVSISTTLAGGQAVTATWTIPASGGPAALTPGDTSEFANSVTVPQPFVVTTAAASGAGSLADEIAAVNGDTGNPNADTIQFQLSTSDSNYNPTTRVWTITPQGALTITHPVILDATFQSGYAGTPVVEINGGGLILGAGSDGSTIRGLDIVDVASGAGLDIGSGKNTVQSNDIGILPDGVTAAANGQGILISGSNNTIGGTAAGAGNVIAFNTGDGVDVASGTVSGDAIRQNLIYQNGQNIVLASGANGGQQPPNLTGASSVVGTSTIQGTITGFAATTTYDIDFFASTAADPPGTTQAHILLGSVPITTDASGNATINVTLNSSVPFGQTITATATSPTGNTSELAAAVTVTNPFVVTTTADNATNPPIGSLRQVIESINAAAPGTSTITFDIPGPGPFVITLDGGTPLPAITRPVLIDGTSEPGYVSTPLVEINAEMGLVGLTLGPHSDGSTIQGLSIVGAGAGILIQSGSDQIIKDYLGVTTTGANGGNQFGVVVGDVGQTTIGGTAATANLIEFNTQAGVSITGASATGNIVASNVIENNRVGVGIDASDNTIGGTVSGAGNTIAFNTGDGVDVNSGTGNAIRQNLIYGNTGTGIVLTGTANNSQQPPSSLAYTSVPSLTTIDYTVNGTSGQTYAIDFFASSGLGAPASVYLGSTSVTLTGSSQSFTATFNLPTALVNGQTVTATATDPNGNSSAFATSAGFTDPFVVNTGSDGVVGSLRQAILDTNADPGTPITFTLPSPYQITLTASLPVITQPVIIEGTSLPNFAFGSTMVQLIGNTNNVGGDGLTLGSGSNVSTIEGLAIGGFLSGAGIRVESNNDQILGNYVGVLPGATPVSNPNALGIYVSGSNDTIGGTAPGAANAIADNNGAGVTVDTGTGDLISANAIYNNSQGIVLQNGGNQTLALNGSASPPPPILTSASTTGMEISISGQLTGLAANTAITIEFFASQSGDLSVPDQANVFLGSTTATTDGNGNASFSLSDLAASVSEGQTITATASAAGLGTSPLAANIQAASPFEVTTTADNGSNTNPTIGSFRQALIAAIATPGMPIEFDIPTTDPNYNAAASTWTINIDPDPPLPDITSPVIIDGTTQPGYYQEAQINPLDPAPVILINGGGGAGNGLTLALGSSGSTIKGLAIFGFKSGAGIDVQSNGNLLAADWLGVYSGAGDTVLSSPNAVGLAIQGGSNNTIGLGAVLTIAPPSDSSLSAITVRGLNLISGNTGDGIQITSPVAGLAASDNLIQDTFIGTDATGNTGLGNGGYGIEIDNGMGNTVGGTTTDTLVLDSGNTKGGILISGDLSVGQPSHPAASANLVQNSYIGTNVAGTQKLANLGAGIVIDDSSANTIGGTVTATGDGTTFPLVDLISGNTGLGVMIQDGASHNLVENSYIGSDILGQNAVPNTGGGVEILDSSNNQVGTTTPGFENLISGNHGAGVLISGASSTDNAVVDSLIGPDLTGSNTKFMLHNSGDGIDVVDAVGTMVGFTGSIQNPTAGGNTISGNSGNGVSIGGSASGTVLLFNRIGTDGTGTFINRGLNNQGYGVLVDSTSSQGSTIGGTITVSSQGGPLQGTFNVISGNVTGGIALEGQGSNLVAGNLVGTDITGTVALGNTGDGIDVVDSVNNTIGGTESGVGNLISANSGAGVSISGAGASGNDVFGNVIGTDISESLSLGNAKTGIVINGSSQNTIGSAASSGGNRIAGNQQDGLDILGGSGNTVVANTIGGTAGESASAVIGNGVNGILIANSGDNTIGSAPTQFTAVGTPDQLGPGANQVVGNGGDGIFVSISGTLAVPNTITGNLVARNSHNGIHLLGDLSGDQSLAQIRDNFIGTILDGTSTYDSSANDQSQGNGLSGILLVSTSSPNLAPTPVVATTVSGNVVSNNGASGVTVERGTNSIAAASVLISDNLIGTDKTGENVSEVSSTNSALTFGNVTDGIELDDVTGVTIGGPASPGSVSLALATSGGNLIAGNVGEGILLNGATGNTISSNLIGVVLSSTSQQVAAKDTNLNNAGNLSDGIFVLNSNGEVIEGNLVSNNRGYGIHAFGNVTQQINGAVASIDLLIAGNFIGTNNNGTSVIDTNGVGLGNGTDGVFLDSVGAVTVGGTAAGAGNVISGNHADGVDVLQAAAILIAGNEIGTNLQGFSAPGSPTLDLGNSSNGVFINQSSAVTVGGITTGAGNTISGNHSSGVFLSGTVTSSSGTTNANQNVIEGNWIGVGVGSQGQTTAVPNAVVGIILSNANFNTIGGSVWGAANVVSANSLDGILLVNDAQHNVIEDNLIGTDPTASSALGNSADGLFLLGSSAITIKGVIANTTPSTISGNTIASNVIAGNNEDGIQVFGTGATSNTFTLNFIGLSSYGNAIPNGADGVLLNDAGSMNVVGGNDQGNFISGNNQAGVEITGSPDATNGTLVVGNFIGTNLAGNSAVANGSYGVLVYGSSANTIGGAKASTGIGLGNVISGNSQAGIQIFNPGGTHAIDNLVLGNLIGTNAAGNAGLGNGSDGVQIENASQNTIGGTSTSDRNVISGNAGNGVLIDQFPNLTASADVVINNFIGTNANGTGAVGNLANGVALIDGSANTIGGISGGATLANTQVTVSGGPGNLISGNAQWGVMIQLTGASTGQPQSVIQGNVIGLDESRTFAISNGQGGIVVNNVTTQPLNQTIGGSAAGAGNIITGNGNVGIQLIGGTAGGSGFNDVVAGNLIGLNAAGQIVYVGGGTGNVTGILVDNSPGNLIGGTSSADRNVISGNSQSGIQIFDVLSTGDLVLGNFIGTNLAGNAFPAGSSEVNPPQSDGVLIDGASGDTVGQTTSGAGNLLSGNAVGVEITGVKQNGGQVFGSGNVVAGNLIGTDASGTQPVSNLDLGVFVNNSQGNVIGPGNVIAANGIAGVEIVADGSQQNLVAGNMIGEGIGGEIFSSRGRAVLSSNGPEPGIPVYADAELNGVVVLGASNNTIGVDKRVSGSAGNTISGDVQVGVYITSRDFDGKVYPVPINNSVSGNLIRSNGIYGVLLYDAPNNPVRPFTSSSRFLIKNRIGAQEISFRNFQAAFDSGTSLPTKGLKVRHHTKVAHVVHRQKAHHVKVEAQHHVTAARALHRARPRVPALFESKAKH
jgi:hypothetical protein